MNLFGLDGKVAVVTGAGANGGIGHAIALGFARAGTRLAIADSDEAGLAESERELSSLGAAVLSVRCDIANPAEIEALFAAVDGKYGRLDVLVNVPFLFARRVVPHELSLDEWQRMLAVNLTGHFLCIQSALRRMLACGGGSIINIGSNAGVSALGRGAFAYSSAKAALHQMTKELAVEYAGRNIRVNALVPAQVMTPGLREHLHNPQFRDRVLPRMLNGLPLGRLLEPEELVGPAIFLASEAAQAITGALLPVDGGNLALNAGGSHNSFFPKAAHD